MHSRTRPCLLRKLQPAIPQSLPQILEIYY
jgi:hypothetical protein